MTSCGISRSGPLLRDSGVFRRAVVIEGMGEERRYRVEELLP